MKHFLLAAALVAAPIAASAATVAAPDAGKTATAVGMLTPGGTESFVFTLDKPMDLDFSVAVTGAEDDVKEVTYQYSFGGFTSEIMNLVFAENQGITGAGYGNFSISALSDVTLTFFDGVAETVGITVTAAGDNPAPVPLPAGVVLLGSALAGAGFMGKRRRKA
ncbi:VPLPA-CTERM sorting domain-containing protein [Frigidibacter sp. MR17.14]|uniref:VPLPA-CTERM sorting domain-containing protein n=1 Tax=Frigidibacter sp. MR17.14 TaxID=3126509 RepID=UPI003012CB21